MPSLYAEYTKEREDNEILEYKEGFITFRMEGIDVCYIVDLFVKKENRKSNFGLFMANEVTRIAKENGCKMLLGSIDPSTNGAHESLTALLYYGFKLHTVEDGLIFFKKEI